VKVIATIQADLKVTPLGTRSRLGDVLSGSTVLRRTVERVCGAKSVEAVYVLCPVGDREACEQMLRGTRAIVRSFDAGPSPWTGLVQTARKWSLHGWRGGIGGTTYFDEFTDIRLLCKLLDEVQADAALAVPAAAPLLDPGLMDQMIEHRRAAGDDITMTFTQAPPGIAGILLDASLVRQLAEKNIPVGWIFSYKPDDPSKDLIFQPTCCDIPAELRHAVGRLTADTDRSVERVSALLGDHAAPDLATIGRWLTSREVTCTESLPREVEIELTTDDPYPEAFVRPRGTRLDARGPIDLAVVKQIVGEIIRYDDALVVLGGFGDPLRHPRFVDVLETIRSVRRDGRGLYGLAVRTAAADLTEEHVEAMISREVDILSVLLDAWTPELYGKLQSPSDPAAADLDGVLKRLDRLSDARQKRNSIKPTLVPEMTKSRDNAHELDEFHDGWLRRAGTVCISGYGHYARQLEDRSVICMAPSPRVACRRIRSRCVVLADGRVTLCDQDYNGGYAVGRIGEQSLEQLWLGQDFERVRTAHRQGRFDPTPLCASCDEWHRP
jgi:hypothetical protein